MGGPSKPGPCNCRFPGTGSTRRPYRDRAPRRPGSLPPRRLPALYLGDLFTYPPRYWHPRCGEVKTFGWCSEREMAAGVLLQAMKRRSKIKQEGVHVWTEVLLKMEGPDRRPRPAVLSLDHTFDLVDAWPLRGSAEAWAADFGDGAQVGWYNKVARSPEELRKVREIRVSRDVSLRFYTGVDAWMGVIER